ncbi:hypothetical protein CMI37_18825 [Candidatus Pacearchaeota archaeon]|nr:hypothetical protein [Candidatus Pacearchaeota archaeon]
MPLVRNTSSGAEIFASAKTARKYEFTVPQGGSSVLNATMLPVTNLPQCMFFCLMTAGPANCTFTPQFAVDNRPDGVGGIEPDWQPGTIPQVIVLNVPIILTLRLIANMTSGLVTVPGGGAAGTFRLIISASQ